MYGYIARCDGERQSERERTSVRVRARYGIGGISVCKSTAFEF